MKYIYDNNIIEELTEHILNIQSIEVEKKLNTLIEAMKQGIFSSATKKALDELE